MSATLFFLYLLGLMILQGPASATPQQDPVLHALQDEASTLKPLATTPLARRFLEAAAGLPAPPTKTLYYDPGTGLFHQQADLSSLPDSTRLRLESRTYDGNYYYQTRYGTPFSYLRLVELVAQAGLTNFAGTRVLDFGYGRVGHLRLIASLGAYAVGVDVDPLLPALYGQPEDQGVVPGFGSPDGSLRVVHGYFPGDSAVCAAVGAGYDLVLSRNTLKGGHETAKRAAQSKIINLGVSDSVFVQAIHACLKPGGWFLMYTLSSPKGNGHCPFTESMLRRAGFDIVAYDADDTEAARAARRALDPDQDDASTAIATYTLVRKSIQPR